MTFTLSPESIVHIVLALVGYLILVGGFITKNHMSTVINTRDIKSLKEHQKKTDDNSEKLLDVVNDIGNKLTLAVSHIQDLQSHE